MDSPLRKRILHVLALGVPTLLILLCLRKFNFQVFVAQLGEIQIFYCVAAFFSTLLILVAMALQWGLFLPPDRTVGFKRMFQVVSVFAMLVNIVPFWGGHAFAVYLLGHKEKVGKTAALSVITLEQIAEGFGKILLFAVVAFTCPFPLWMKQGMQMVTLAVLGAYVILFGLAYRFRDQPTPFSRLKPIGWRRFFLFLSHWAHHLHALRDFKKIAGGILLAFTMKGLEALTIYWVQKSFGLSLPAYAPWLVLAALGLATMLPLSPGRLGIFEGTVFLIYQYLGVDPTRALALGLFLHIFHTAPLVMAGYFVSLKMGIAAKKISSLKDEGVVFAASES